MIRIVVSSFYNTLINLEEAIPTSTMLEIDRIRNTLDNISVNIQANRNKNKKKYNTSWSC